ncbi:hypothetical protein OZ10_18595 [Xanthomonas cannabis pv. cannabis]|nr:hypothetical protein OZ10_18595 [Xanthomonas cannabis pv. cannabis]
MRLLAQPGEDISCRVFMHADVQPAQHHALRIAARQDVIEAGGFAGDQDRRQTGLRVGTTSPRPE